MNLAGLACRSRANFAISIPKACAEAQAFAAFMAFQHPFLTLRKMRKGSGTWRFPTTSFWMVAYSSTDSPLAPSHLDKDLFAVEEPDGNEANRKERDRPGKSGPAGEGMFAKTRLKIQIGRPV